MTKPNNFILNSDYLSLAQTDTKEFTAYFAAETFGPGYAFDRTADFTVPYSQGSIDMVLISLNGGEYTLGAQMVASMGSPATLAFLVSRISPNTIRVRLHEVNFREGGYSMPAQTLKVKVSSFKPPNVF